MLFGLFKKHEEPIRLILNQSSTSASRIEFIEQNVGDIEIVWFLLLIYARLYKNCCSFYKSYKDDLNNIFQNIPKNSPFESLNYEINTTKLIEINNISNYFNKKNAKINLRKGKNGYFISVGHYVTKNPTLYFHCASLLLLPKIKDKSKYINCLTDLANLLNNKPISIMEAVEFPERIISNNYY
ncbi:MAG: hypothetical protein IPM42_21365 [Saprospiraceae bacterium]|nr:hypothetical protein [Saprospiraceae bacterium]